MARKTAATVAFLVLLLAGKIYLWVPYVDFFRVHNLREAVKAVLTVTIALPPHLHPGQTLVSIQGEDYLVDIPGNVGGATLLGKRPPPRDLFDERVDWEGRMESLARFTSKLLPKTSSLPQHPEPDSAIVLLGLGGSDAYPKLCSKDAKIFSQYADATGEVVRMVQLQGHVAAEVFNPESEVWQMYDPYFGCGVRDESGQLISAVKAHDLINAGEVIQYCGPAEVFRTVVHIPRTNFVQGSLPRWHFLSYQNLAYWRVARVSEDTRKLWRLRVSLE